MAKSVVLTNIAETDLENLTDYLLENWGRSVCETFIFRFEQVCEIISLNPTIYPVSYQNEKIRKCVLTPQNAIYYRERNHVVEIITIFDTRQDPDKLQELIKNAE